MVSGVDSVLSPPTYLVADDLAQGGGLNYVQFTFGGKRPAHALDRLRRLAAQGLAGEETISEIAWIRASNVVMAIENCGRDEAERYILTSIGMLAERDYSETVVMGSGAFDVYVLERTGKVWWIKTAIDEDGLVVVSHHPPERDCRTCDGRTFRGQPRISW